MSWDAETSMYLKKDMKKVDMLHFWTKGNIIKGKQKMTQTDHVRHIKKEKKKKKKNRNVFFSVRLREKLKEGKMVSNLFLILCPVPETNIFLEKVKTERAK